MTQKNLINGMPPTSISRGGKPDKSMGHVNGMPPPSNSVGGQPDDPKILSMACLQQAFQEKGNLMCHRSKIKILQTKFWFPQGWLFHDPRYDREISHSFINPSLVAENIMIQLDDPKKQDAVFWLSLSYAVS